MSGLSFKTKIVDVAAHKLVEADVVQGISESHLQDWAAKWLPAHAKIAEELNKREIHLSAWPQSITWNWINKTVGVAGSLAHEGFVLVCKGETQGMMRVDLNHTAILDAQRGKPLVYIEFLEVAPWNQRSPFGLPRRYERVGSALLSAAARLSKKEGFGGRLALHSLPQSASFYQQLGAFEDLGPDQDYQSLRYFEATAEQGLSLI